MGKLFGDLIWSIVISSVLVGLVIGCFVGGCSYYHLTKEPDTKKQELIQSAKEKLTPEEWEAIR